MERVGTDAFSNVVWNISWNHFAINESSERCTRPFPRGRQSCRTNDCDNEHRNRSKLQRVPKRPGPVPSSCPDPSLQTVQNRIDPGSFSSNHRSIPVGDPIFLQRVHHRCNPTFQPSSGWETFPYPRVLSMDRNHPRTARIPWDDPSGERVKEKGGHLGRVPSFPGSERTPRPSSRNGCNGTRSSAWHAPRT